MVANSSLRNFKTSYYSIQLSRNFQLRTRPTKMVQPKEMGELFFEMGRALLIELGLPKYLWTYAIMTATHIRNRCYVETIRSTSYGIITGIKPNLSKMHIFGTICYAHLHNQKKLDPIRKWVISLDMTRTVRYLLYFILQKNQSRSIAS